MSSLKRPAACAPIARNGAGDEPWIHRLQRVVVQSQFLHDSGPEAFQQHIGLPRQLPQDILSFLGLEVQRQGAFVPVQDHVEAAVASELGRPPTDVVAELGVFDLDHVGPEVGEQHGAEGAREESGQIEYGDA